MLNSKKTALFALFILCAAGFAGYFFYNASASQQDNGEELLLYGNIDIREVNLAFYATGRISRMLVDEGDRVRAGDLLAVLDDSRYRHEADRLKAQLEAQQALVERLENGSRPQEKAEARAAVEAAEAELVLAQITLKRTRELSRTKFVPRQQLDQVEAAYKKALAHLQSAKQRLSLVNEGPRLEDKRRARKTLASLEAALALARKQLEDTRLLAPSAGIIQNRILEPGAMASPGTPVFSLALTEPVWVRAYIPEPDLGMIQQGMQVEVTSDSFPEKKYRGWIGFISPVAEFTPKAVQTTELRTQLVYRARCFICNDNGQLRLGMPVTVRVLTSMPRIKSATGFCGSQAL